MSRFFLASFGSCVLVVTMTTSGCGGEVASREERAPTAPGSPAAPVPAPGSGGRMVDDGAPAESASACEGPSGSIALLVPGVNRFSDLVVRQGRLYFVEAQGRAARIRAFDTSGGPITTIHNASGWIHVAPRADGIQWVRTESPSNSEYVSFVEGWAGGFLGSYALGPTGITKGLSAGPPTSGFLSVEASWKGAGGLYRVFHDRAPELIEDTRSPGASLLQGDDLYYLDDSHSGSLLRFSLVDGTKTKLVTDGVFGPLAVDEGDVIVQRRGLDYGLEIHSKIDGALRRRISLGTHATGALWSDGVYLYWTDAGWRTEPSPAFEAGALMRARKEGGAPETLSKEDGGVYQLAADAAAVYFVGDAGIKCYRR